MYSNISILAGRNAIKLIREEGLSISRVNVIAGASGAAKFLVLTRIDRMLLSLLKERKNPLHLIGSSIGAFRMAAYCQRDPIAAINKLEHEYIEQQYDSKPTAKELSLESKRILDAYIFDDEINHMLDHPYMRINFLANKSRGLIKSEKKLKLLTAMALAGVSNYFNREYLGKYLERALFTSYLNEIPINHADDFVMEVHNLTQQNFKSALLASGSIPMAMEGVTNISGVNGVFRDGGLIDYHLDIPFSLNENSFVLFPHFYEQITPGWFDKFTKRKPNKSNLRNVVLVAPSTKFVNSLPYAKIPDRKDFKLFVGNDKERFKYWRTVVKMNKILADEFFNAIDSGNIRNIVKPIDTE